MKERKSPIELTPAMKAKTYTPEQIGEDLYAKLKDDPNFALMSMFCTNSGLYLAKKVEYYEQVNTKPEQIMMSYDNMMWSWDDVELIVLTVDPGYRDDRHRILHVRVPFPDMVRLMSEPLLSGSLEEVLAFLRSPEFGPKQMMTLERLNTALGKHD